MHQQQPCCRPWPLHIWRLVVCLFLHESALYAHVVHSGLIAVLETGFVQIGKVCTSVEIAKPPGLYLSFPPVVVLWVYCWITLIPLSPGIIFNSYFVQQYFIVWRNFYWKSAVLPFSHHLGPNLIVWFASLIVSNWNSCDRCFDGLLIVGPPNHFESMREYLQCLLEKYAT